MIPANGEFVVRDYLEAREDYKFIFDTRSNAKVEIFDADGNLATSTTVHNGCIYLKQMVQGLVKVVVSNLETKEIKFSYKAPDVKKEIQGSLGFIQESDLLQQLINHLDSLVSHQEKHVKKSNDHYDTVKKSRKWIRLIILFEMSLTAFALYLIHKDFITMFESKRNV